MLRILAILFTLTAAVNDVNTAEVGIERRRQGGFLASQGGFLAYPEWWTQAPPARLNLSKAEHMVDMKKEDMKKGKMYKKFSEMSKKKLMQMIKKCEKKIAIMKKALKAKKKEKKN